MLRIGLKEIPVIPFAYWTDAQVKAFRLIANRSGAWAAWDLEQVALELTELKELVFDLSMTSFDPSETRPLPDIAILDDMSISVVYECGPKRSTHYWDEIQFARFNLEWLTDSRDSLCPLR